MTDGDRKLAEELRDELLDRAWAEREAFVYKLEPLEQSVARAKAMPAGQPGEGPIVLLDHYDNCASGGTMDTTAVLAAILAGLENVAAFAIYDPEAVQQAIAAGIGAKVTLSIGGKIEMPAIPAESRPLTVTGTVKTISNGRFRNRGPMARGVADGHGAAVVLDTGTGRDRADLAPCRAQRPQLPVGLGIDPLQKRYVMLKSRIHWRAGLGRWRKSRRRMRRRRRLHVGLRATQLQKRPPPDLPARSAEPLGS